MQRRAQGKMEQGGALFGRSDGGADGKKVSCYRAAMVGKSRELAMSGGQERMELGSWEKKAGQRGGVAMGDLREHPPPELRGRRALGGGVHALRAEE